MTYEVLKNLPAGDIIRNFRVNNLFLRVSKEVLKWRYNNVLRKAAGTDYEHFRTILDDTGSIILGSSATDYILFTTTTDLPIEMRIVTPVDAAEPVKTFFIALGFTVLPCEHMTGSTPHTLLSFFKHSILKCGDYNIILIHSANLLVMPVVLTLCSSIDCMFLTSGGVFLAYPKFVDQRLAYVPGLNPRSAAVTRTWKCRLRVPPTQ
ncbi:hypothetical protein F4604DRAFT_1924199 [Suillus subluteus]|nr:hypothetical protein F4604DRAFT_1924199 [Suillus subluteus]